MLKRTYPDQPIVGVAAIVIREGKILLEKRKNQPGKGKWSIPGGVVNLGESLEQAVIREVNEETCLEVDSPCLIDVVSDVSLDENGRVKYHFVIVDYFVSVQRGEPAAASDADALNWVPFNDVEEYDLTRSFRTFFKRNRQKMESL
jgi:ADP-ribose pyrophosphatase YjhB (NUDIX family)